MVRAGATKRKPLSTFAGIDILINVSLINVIHAIPMNLGMQPPPSLLPDCAAAAGGRPVVAPFARALSVLSAFAPGERWLSNGDLVERTGLPA
jgi:hypothetical protein